MSYNIGEISKQFDMGGDFVDAKPYGSGHINDTYRVTCSNNGIQISRILQRVNHSIFKDPVGMMENISRVTEHIRKIPTCNGAGCYKDGEGNYWRMFDFIDGGITYDTLQSPEQTYMAAKMFGNFQAMLVDLEGGPLHETIVDFHNGPKRFRDFQQVLKADCCFRAATAKPEIDFILENSGILDVLTTLVETGQIPVLVTHNDTKINNVIIDKETGQGLSVIDLDTVMPGLSLYDFGDMIRSATSPADEDERDLSKVTMRMEMFEKLVSGFLSETKSFMTEAEISHLAFSGQMITFEQAVRFLGDYLAGDTYYKTARDGHNLDRTRTQIKLVQSIIEQEEAMDAYVAGC